jgi:hypothetical protein
LLKIINDKWKLMPQSVQVFTYLLVVFLFAYLLITPQYIDGKLLGVNENGKPYAIQHEIFEIDVDGRIIRFVTNGRGRFAIPKTNKFPLNGVELTFFPSGAENGSPEVSIIVPLSDAVIGRTTIINNEGVYSILDDKVLETVSILKGLIINMAYAENGITSFNNKSGLEEVQKLFKTEAPSMQITDATKLSDLKLTKSQLSRVLSGIEQDQGIVINTDRNKIDTIGDLAIIVQQQKEPQHWNPVIKSSWVKPKGLFTGNYVLKVKDSGFKIRPIKLLDDSANIEILLEKDGNAELVFTGSLYGGERVIITDDADVFSIQLEKVDSAGFDRFINRDAAYFNVNKK